ncbi:MAG: PspA-associated protein PspAB [Marmoricola sp.]
MGLLDILRGRSQPKAPNLDNLFAVPGAAITLQTSVGLTPTGEGAVCYRAAQGAAMSDLQQSTEALIEADGGPQADRTVDGYGFTWLLVHGDPADVSGLMTDLHAVNTGLETQGFGSSLLCSLVAFTDGSGRRLGLVYLYKRGTFYPFCPTGPKSRDTLLERQVRDALGNDLRIEPDTSRWMPVWGAPGLG